MTSKQRIHREWFRRVSVRQIQGEKHLEEYSRKSCPSCKDKLEPNEWVWSWGEYQYGKWRTVRHFCKHCFPDIQRDLDVHRDQCGCDFELVIKDSIHPEWLTLPQCSISK